MKNNKLVVIMFVILIAIALVGTIAVVVILNSAKNNGNGEPSIDQILEASVDIQEITTNLASNDYIRISFKIQTNSKKAKQELEKREFQVRNVIIHTLSEKRSDEIQGSQGHSQLEDEIKLKINEFMQTGKVERVYITESLLQ